MLVHGRPSRRSDHAYRALYRTQFSALLFAVISTALSSAALGQPTGQSNPPPSSHGAAQGGQHSGRNSLTPLERQQESYAIYSLLMPGEVFAKMDSSQNRQWAIAQITINAEDINPALAPDAALKAPENHPRPFQEALADYYLGKFQRSTLSRNMTLDRPYKLLTPDEVAEFRAARGHPGTSSDLKQKYTGYPGVTYFSRVYFDSAGTAALVYMLDWCGNLCAQAEWVYLEKRGGQWVRRSGKSAS
jgi:hypothetical protein